MRTLVLVKHSLPEVDPAAPPETWSLNDTGRQRSRRLADLLAPLAPAVLITSPEPKAAQTTAILASRLGGEVAVEYDLREQERPQLGWLSSAAFELAVAGSIGRPTDRVRGMEPADAARRRFTAAIQRLIARHSHGNLVVVGHGTVISLFAAPLLGLSALDLWRRLGLPSYVAMTLPDLAPVAVVDRIRGHADDRPGGAR